MKKFFIGLFAGLIAVFGSIASVSTKSSFNNFNEFKSVQNAVVETSSNEYTFYFDSEVNNYTVISLAGIFSALDDNARLDIIKEDSSLESFIGGEVLNFFVFSMEGVYINSFNFNNDYAFQKMSNNYTENGITTTANTWYFVDISNSYVVRVLGFKLIGYSLNNTLSSVEELNVILEPYIGNLTSLPSDDPVDPVPPSPPSQNFLDDITSTINGVIDWFVDLFNGLADIFVIYDSNGSFAGFSLWGNVLFIEVSIMLVVIVLRWVISLIRGI